MDRAVMEKSMNEVDKKNRKQRAKQIQTFLDQARRNKLSLKEKMSSKEAEENIYRIQKLSLA